MPDEDLKKNLESYLKKQLEPINRKNIEAEMEKHQRFRDKHAAKSEKLAEKHSAFISQLITLEGAILTAVIIFGKPEEATNWIVLAISFILISIFFGVWVQNIGAQADYQSQEWEYQQELEHHWWTRELWKDETVKAEKELIEQHLKDRENAYKSTFTYKILKFFNLTHDRVENIFKITFLISLVFLILHFVSIPLKVSKADERWHDYKSRNFKFHYQR